MKWLWLLWIAGCTGLGSEQISVERAPTIPLASGPAAQPKDPPLPRPISPLRVLARLPQRPSDLLATGNGVAWIEGSEIKFHSYSDDRTAVLGTGSDLHALTFDSASLTFYWSGHDGIFGAKQGQSMERLAVPWTVVDTLSASVHGIVAGVEEPTPGVWVWFSARRPRLARLARTAARGSPAQLTWGHDAEVLFSLERAGPVIRASSDPSLDAVQIPGTSEVASWALCGEQLVLTRAATLLAGSDLTIAPVRITDLPAAPTVLSCCGNDVCWASQQGQVGFVSLKNGVNAVLADTQPALSSLSGSNGRVVWVRRASTGADYEIVSMEWPTPHPEER